MNQCFGWTCPDCSHHWISCFRIGAMTCKCGYEKTEDNSYRKFERRRAERLALSEALSILSPVDANREVRAS